MKTIKLPITITGVIILITGIANNVHAQNANTSLSNLTTTSINQTLKANADKAFDLGTLNVSWKNLYLKGGIYLNRKKCGSINLV